tara:strand:+ start:316 stop:444 length:129 start_codon:yes stop_codon:yes gene_type:complete
MKVFLISGNQNFCTNQGTVYAIVSLDFAKEFNFLLKVGLTDM